MKILIDMNLSPSWTDVFKKTGYRSVHWSEIGRLNADDQTIFKYALSHKYIIFTHDLDFGAILSLTKGIGPSVIQVRTQDVTPDHLGKIIIKILKKYQKELLKGALIIVDEEKLRLRILPLK